MKVSPKNRKLTHKKDGVEGEVKVQNRSMTKVEEEKFTKMLQAIARNEMEGFFYVGQKITDENRGGYTMDGGLYSNKMSPDQIMRVLIHTFGIDEKAMSIALAMSQK